MYGEKHFILANKLTVKLGAKETFVITANKTPQTHLCFNLDSCINKDMAWYGSKKGAN